MQVIGLTVSGDVLEEADIPYNRISEYLYLFEDRREIMELGEAIGKETYNPKSGIPYDDMAAYLGLSFRDLIRQCGSRAQAWEAFRAEGRGIFNPVFCMERILGELKPDLLVITCTVRMERAAAIAANRLTIPVVRIADLPIVEPMDFECNLCVMNEFAKEYTVRNHLLPEKKVFVTGQPVFADKKYLDQEENSKFREKIKPEKYKKIITYLDAPLCPDSEVVQRELEAIAAVNQDNLYIFKLHPNQFDDERWILGNLLKIKELNTRVLLRHSDAVITRNSTAGIEAVLMDKPLLVVFINGEESFDYSEFGVAKKIKDIAELGDSIAECCDRNSEWSERMQRGRERFYNDDHALDNIAGVIRTILEDKEEKDED